MTLTHRFAFYPPATASARRGFFQARSCSSVCLATCRDCTTRDASEPTSATQHVFDYEHPRLVDSQCLVTRLSPRADWGIERFTTPNSLRRAVRLCFVGGRFLPQTFPSLRSDHEPTDRTSGTSVASPSLINGASARIDRHQGRQDCIHRASVKITRFPQPEMPSIDR